MNLCGENIKISQVNYHARYQRPGYTFYVMIKAHLKFCVYNC
jgi:hypothetical protein